MKALILLSHGSRRQESNDEMIQLAKTISAIEKQPYAKVVCAFQQFAEPSFNIALTALADAGVTQVIVFPLFLAAGSHVLEDVPNMMAQAQADHPNIHFTIIPHLGQITELANFLLKQAVHHS